MLIKTKSGRLVEMPSPEEDAIITAAAMSDPDAMPLTDEEWEVVKPFVRIGCPPANQPLQVFTTIGFDADVLAAFKALGNDWQTRINDVMRNYIATLKHS
jgi:uncharacterized protein (DUF4415 family)